MFLPGLGLGVCFAGLGVLLVEVAAVEWVAVVDPVLLLGGDFGSNELLEPVFDLAIL